MALKKIQLCRWCGNALAETSAIVGFGDGSGNHFVHRDCFDDYKKLKAILGSYSWGRIKRLLQIHNEVIAKLEEYMNRDRMVGGGSD